MYRGNNASSSSSSYSNNNVPLCRIVEAQENDIGNEVLRLFNDWCAERMRTLLELGVGGGDANTPEIEFEARMGVYNDKKRQFEPGVSRSYFAGMLNVFKKKVQENKWLRADNREEKVGYAHTTYYDVLFEDNVRVTAKLHRSKPPIVDRVEIIEVIVKRKVGSPKDFKIDGPNTGTRYHLRIGVASEEHVPEGNPRYASHTKAATKAIMDAYNVSSKVKLIGGIDLRLKDSVPFVIMTFPPDGEQFARGRIGFNDPLYVMADQNDGKLDGKIARQLKWTLLTPSMLPGVGGTANVILSTKKTFPSKLYVTNLPGVVQLPDGTKHVAYSAQYTVGIEDRYILCGHGRFANPTGDDDVTENLRIKHFRLKNRWSFELRKNQRLDMTEIRSSQNLSTIEKETKSFEVEIEKMFTFKEWESLSSEILAKSLRVVGQADAFLADIASRLFGVALPPLNLSRLSAWSKQEHVDKSRTLEFLETFKKDGASALKKRKRDDDDGNNEDQKGAADFYNKLNRSSQGSRHQSLIYHMRCLNNFVKSVIIKEGVSRVHRDCNLGAGGNGGLRILDLACGKGADLQKFMRSLKKDLKIDNYAGIDIARVSLDDAVDRLKNIKHRTFPVKFVEADLGMHSISAEPDSMEDLRTMEQWDTTKETWQKLPPSQTLQGEEFNLVSMQFAFHYMFQKDERVHHFFKTLSKHMSTGGVFIACTVHASEMLTRLMGAGPDATSFSIRDEFGVEACKVEFDPDFRKSSFGKFKPSDDSTPAGKRGPGTTDVGRDTMGIRYQFTLRDGDSDQDQAVAAPEWLIPIELLLKLATVYHLKVVRYERLPNAAMRYMERDKPEALFRKMNVLNHKGTISQVEWDIASLYVVVELQKEPKPKSIVEMMGILKERIPDYANLPAQEKEQLLNAIRHN